MKNARFYSYSFLNATFLAGIFYGIWSILLLVFLSQDNDTFFFLMKVTNFLLAIFGLIIGTENKKTEYEIEKYKKIFVAIYSLSLLVFLSFIMAKLFPETKMYAFFLFFVQDLVFYPISFLSFLGVILLASMRWNPKILEKIIKFMCPKKVLI